MSERKSKRESVKKQPNIKPPSTKQKILFPSKPENEVSTVTKNLLRDFNEAQSQHHHRQQRLLESQKLKESGLYSQSLQQSSDYQSSESRFEKYELAEQHPTSFKPTRTEIVEYSELQLPKSYVLAMRGLQEAVEQREKETHKAKRQIKEQKTLYDNLYREKEELELAKTALQAKVNQCIIENKFYRQTINDMKIQAAQQSRIKIDLQRQLKLAQQAISHHENEAENLKKDIQTGIREKGIIKEELQRAIRSMEQKKNDYNELLLKRSEQFAHNYSEIGSLRQEMSKLKEQHQKDVSQINILKEEVAILSQKIVFDQARFKEKALFQEKIQLDKLEKELEVNRNILQEVTFDQNRLRQSFNEHLPIPVQQKQSPPAPTPVKLLNQPEQSVNFERSTRQERSSTMRQDRSVSRLRQTNDCEHPERRQFIGQMRELMRHQKQLISLNYQMEVLERGMLESAPNKREEAQRTYAKMRRNIEKKEADIRQLKTFIDRATTNTLK